eukprot:TRINITY_DN615_c0_g5_i1.p1 TRINITY_DN615_c0_g5~~TRINITY_DN615_c0_g5_i1.p1  ORF type:complete len:1042 (-),score=181.47 TRINITY_DN615_c0_g5_i1:74-3022(-)
MAPSPEAAAVDVNAMAAPRTDDGNATPRSTDGSSTGAQTAMDADNAVAVGVEAPPTVPVSAPLEIELPKETEEDAGEDTRTRLRDQVQMHVSDTTLNVLPSDHGNVLVPIVGGPLQYLLAGARANVGIKGGRYVFEAKVIEILNPQESRDYGPHTRQRLPVPRQVLKIGLAVEGSSLFIGDDEGSICFDSEGAVTYNKEVIAGFQKFSRDQVIGLLLNLEEGSANCNTVSLFRDGVRVCKPQPLPETLKGKPLFPAFTFRCVTVQVNFGPLHSAQLPFVCRTLQDAAQADVFVAKDPTPKDGKYDVIFPVCLPDEGTFDWLDQFLEKNPEYTELSDRMLLDWAEKSGLPRPRAYPGSNDKPDTHFGIPQIDEESFRRVLTALAPMQNRNMVVMEVKASLMKDERRELLKRFSISKYRKVANILMGEPAKDFKEAVKKRALKEKQRQSDADWKARKLVEKQKRVLERRTKELERERRKHEKQAKKSAAEATKKEQEERKARSGDSEEVQVTNEDKMTVDRENEAEKSALESADEGDDGTEDVKEEEDCPPPEVELTDEETKRWFRKASTSDISPHLLSACFTNFTIPDEKEGFDEIRFGWQTESTSKDHMKRWISERKITTRVESIAPGAWFRDQWSSWQGQLHRWHERQTESKDLSKGSVRAPAESGLANAGRADNNNGDEEKADQDMKDVDAQKTKLGEATDKDGKENLREGSSSVEGEDDGFDIYGVANVNDVDGKGQPLFSRFSFEDWALLSLRFELYLLVHAFRRDINDIERVGIHEDLVPFYYNRYFKKAFSTKCYGADTCEEMLNWVRDTVSINSQTRVLETYVSDDLDNFDLFVKLTEESRRDRQLRLDAGEKLPPLAFARPPPPVAATPALGLASAVGSVGGGQRPYDGHKGYSRSEPYQRTSGKGPQTGKSYGPPVGKGGYGGYVPSAPKGGTGYYSGKSNYPNQSKGGYSSQQGYNQRKPHSGPYGKGSYGR